MHAPLVICYGYGSTTGIQVKSEISSFVKKYQHDLKSGHVWSLELLLDEQAAKARVSVQSLFIITRRTRSSTFVLACFHELTRTITCSEQAKWHQARLQSAQFLALDIYKQMI